MLNIATKLKREQEMKEQNEKIENDIIEEASKHFRFIIIIILRISITIILE
jgi:hypothetical protein